MQTSSAPFYPVNILEAMIEDDDADEDQGGASTSSPRQAGRAESHCSQVSLDLTVIV